MQVVRLPPVVEFRMCPGCRFVQSQRAIVRLRFDFPCPRCEEYKLSQFVPYQRPKPTPPGGRKRLKKAA